MTPQLPGIGAQLCKYLIFDGTKCQGYFKSNPGTTGEAYEWKNLIGELRPAVIRL